MLLDAILAFGGFHLMAAGDLCRLGETIQLAETETAEQADQA